MLFKEYFYDILQIRFLIARNGTKVVLSVELFQRGFMIVLRMLLLLSLLLLLLYLFVGFSARISFYHFCLVSFLF